jgi:hypothetical protein
MQAGNPIGWNSPEAGQTLCAYAQDYPKLSAKPQTWLCARDLHKETHSLRDCRIRSWV